MNNRTSNQLAISCVLITLLSFGFMVSGHGDPDQVNLAAAIGILFSILSLLFAVYDPEK